MRKKSPTWPQKAPKRSGIIFPGGLRVPLPADHLSWENASKSLGVGDPSRWGEDPRALRPLRGDRRIRGVQAVSVEAESGESSGVHPITIQGLARAFEADA